MDERFDYPALLERSRTGAFRLSIDGRLLDANSQFAALLGFASREELLAHGRIEFARDSDAAMILLALRELRSLPGLEVALRRRDGTLLWTHQNVAISRDGSGVDCIEAVVLEMPDGRMRTDQFEHLVYHDPLTGLPNRTLFADRLRVAVARARRVGQRVAVCYVDVDHFAVFNERYGVRAGDRLLKGLALRLTEALRLEDSIARCGSDEFVFLLAEFGSSENTAVIAQRVLEAAHQPFSLGAGEIRVTATLGISLFPSDAEDADVLIDRAASAMYRAKEVGRNTYQLYEPAMNARAVERGFLIENLRLAVEQSDFTLHFQPQLDPLTGRIECAEALLRWTHPLLGVVDPARMLAAVEQTQIIDAVQEWVLREAVAQLREWRSVGVNEFRVAVNVTEQQICRPDFPHKLAGLLAASGVEPSSIELEVSDRRMKDPDATAAAVRRLRTIGVGVALDDFGTGLCSFSRLKDMPVAKLKIDRSFVKGLPDEPMDAAMIDAIVSVGDAMHLRVVAQGVETLEQFGFLMKRESLLMQGFYLGRPVPAAELMGSLQHPVAL
jgi:diguanylate cyclase (GGDEF)-like protein/PAS domain S-box-containing protein